MFSTYSMVLSLLILRPLPVATNLTPFQKPSSNLASLFLGKKHTMSMWPHFLSSWNSISFFYNDFITEPEDIQLCTDLTPSIGFSGYYGGRWFSSAWPPEFDSLDSESPSPSSALFELYPILIAAIIWGHEWSRKSILIHSDNTSVVEILNKGRSRSLTIMHFICRLTLISAQHQFILRAAHIPGHLNSIADSLSRFSFQIFRDIPHCLPVAISNCLITIRLITPSYLTCLFI